MQFILKEKFPDVNGLQLTLLQTKFKLKRNAPFVQILHIHGDHWIAISNLQCNSGKILIYDSVFSTANTQVRQLIENICGSKINVAPLIKCRNKLGVQIVEFMLLLLLPHFCMERALVNTNNPRYDLHQQPLSLEWNDGHISLKKKLGKVFLGWNEFCCKMNFVKQKQQQSPSWWLRTLRRWNASFCLP